MSLDDSVSQWIEKLKAGDADAADRLWQRYYARLVGLARRKLYGRSAAGCRRRRRGRGCVPELLSWHPGESLPRLARPSRTLAANCQDHRAKGLRPVDGAESQETRLRKGSRRLRVRQQGAVRARGIDQIAGPSPTPEFAACVSESVRRLLGVLDAESRAIALGKLEGYTNEEIAARIGRSLPTVERRLRLIRHAWQGKAFR